ncbi:MAG: AAA family ATPase [Methylobacter sp.]|uniref:AAA family ATPase n=1 Tax=Methylobacter sp. TaxID=2051955 RepID=UPI0025E46A21|nr:AAA family ATPase [Methylobacter sp.]MCK9620252.1 AAA family ATPase [Methylobacter sp.]
MEDWLNEDLTNHFLIIKDAHLAMRDNPLVIARLKALANKLLHNSETKATVLLISSQACIPPELEKFITLFDLPLPDEEKIRAVINDLIGRLGETIDAKSLTELTLAFRGLSEHEITQLLYRGFQQDGEINSDDVALVLHEKEQIIKKSGILDMVSSVEKLENIGGLMQLKKWLKQKANILHNLTDARAFGVEDPKGVMIVGMPGCGKSLTAKATASLFKLPLLRLDVGSLMGKYVGESESNMRRALQLAEAVSPCVLWVDELEKAFVGIGSGNAGSEVATRLFGYFLTWMQDKTGAVFVLATANDISALPPELLRKGRFDEIFYVDFPTRDEREGIFAIHLKKRNKNSITIDVKKLAEKTDGFSGADIEAVVKEAIEVAFVDNRTALTTERLITVINNTHPLKIVMKDKVQEYADKFNNLKIKPAS